MESSCRCSYEAACRCDGRCDSKSVPVIGADALPLCGGVPIVAARPGESGKLVRISGKTETRRFLSELGFIIGDSVRVISQNSGNVILDIKGSRIAIDRSLASKLFFAPE
ncbi:MAG: ferrous iron transport protein A [Candidatus Methanoplasma sp.]|jgi:ferrous iron transport protein A|nr:ferrous iron transport protein A [Candidatus Methanoplasma sp.]